MIVSIPIELWVKFQLFRDRPDMNEKMFEEFSYHVPGISAASFSYYDIFCRGLVESGEFVWIDIVHKPRHSARWFSPGTFIQESNER